MPVDLTRRARRAAAVLMVVLAVAPLAACGEAEGDAEGDAEGGAEPDVTIAGVTVDVIALDNTFRPEQLEIAAGTAVRWENRGRNDHNVLPADESQSWGASTEEFLPGDTYTVVFEQPGAYAYYCSIHGTEDVGMVGTVVVRGPDP